MQELWDTMIRQHLLIKGIDEKEKILSHGIDQILSKNIKTDFLKPRKDMQIQEAYRTSMRQDQKRNYS